MHNTVYTFLYNFFYHENTTNFSSYKFAKENLPLLFKLFFWKGCSLGYFQNQLTLPTINHSDIYIWGSGLGLIS